MFWIIFKLSKLALRYALLVGVPLLIKICHIRNEYLGKMHSDPHNMHIELNEIPGNADGRRQEIQRW